MITESFDLMLMLPQLEVECAWDCTILTDLLVGNVEPADMREFTRAGVRVGHC